MKRMLAIAAMVVSLSFLAPASNASAADRHHGGHGNHGAHRNHAHQGSHYRGGHGHGVGHGYGAGYRYGISPYAPSYRYRSGYGAIPYGYRSGYRPGYYPGYRSGSGIHLDINGVHVLGRPHF